MEIEYLEIEIDDEDKDNIIKYMVSYRHKNREV